MKLPALGKGLDALISEETAANVAAEAPKSSQVSVLPLDRIKPNPKQPRVIYRDEAMKELADSMRKRGVLQPILVSPDGDGRYEIIAGERRWRAAKLAGLKELPVVVRTGNEVERFEMAMIENIQREDLNPLEQAQGFARLMNEFKLTQEEVAAIIGKDRTVIANTVRLLNLPEPMQAAVREGQLSAGHARALVAVEDPVAREALFKRVLDEELSVRAVEQAVQAHKVAVKGHVRGAAGQAKAPEVKALEEDLQRALARKVELQAHGAKGWLKLEFYSLDDLDALVAQLKKASQAS